MYEFTIRLGAIAGALLAVGAVVGAVFWRPFRNWVHREIDDRLKKHVDDDHEEKP